MSISLQHEIVYGPIHSRRFGTSLGINILPTDQKICLYDCVYCQYGPTDLHRALGFPTLDQIEGDLAAVFPEWKNHKRPLDWIMIAGNGEPTLHPDFDKVIEILLSFRDRYLFGVPIGILSNSSTCYKPRIQDCLRKLDGRFMKLDAGSPEMFAAVNQPCKAVQWRQILGGLYHLQRIVLQSMFVVGSADNTKDSSVGEWIETVRYIKPESVQVYTVSRPTSQEGILPASRPKLDQIAELLMENTRIPAYVYD